MQRILFLLATVISIVGYGQKKAAVASAADSEFLSKTKFRLVGPFRGGRSGAVGQLRRQEPEPQQRRGQQQQLRRFRPERDHHPHGRQRRCRPCRSAG